MTTSDPVKLSVHMSGLVQFSVTGKSVPSGGRLAPKGIGIFSHPLLDAPPTGPTFGATIYDIRAHAPLTGTEASHVISFGQLDIARWTPPVLGRAHGYHVYYIEVFALNRSVLTEARLSDGELVLTRPYSTIQPDFDVSLRLVVAPTSLVIYGVMVNLRHAYHEKSTRPFGYTITGPKDLLSAKSLAGFWPPELAEGMSIRDPNLP
jgi:hypothetical protein